MLGNGLVLWVIVMGVKLRSMTDICLFNLSLADLLLVGSLPFLAYQLEDHWVFGDGMCKLVLGVYYVGYYSGIYFITLMGVDRYLAIVHAVYALRVRTRTYGIIASAVVWVAAICSSFPEVLALELTYDNTTDTYMCIRNFNKLEGLSNVAIFKMNVVGFVIPLAVLVFCYTRILLVLLQGRTAKRQAVRLVVVVMVAFFCCWAPYNISLFLYGLNNMELFGIDCESTNSLMLSLQVTEVIAYTHCCLNPVLYVFVGVKLRRHLFKLLSKSVCVRCGFLKGYLTAASGGSVYSRTSNASERSTAL
ncbi:C-C chemokine receptor type 1-like [Engraulis encrasicolus]|uniref:C-C chemokine receptor type 1-like n=1 Tax=Engraulis encrasicolus TaxID=184585 RepID=UPI002FD0786D